MTVTPVRELPSTEALILSLDEYIRARYGLLAVQTFEEERFLHEPAPELLGRVIRAMPVLVEAFVVVGDQSEAQAAAKLWNFIPKAFKGYQNIPDPAQIEHRAQTELPLSKVFGSRPKIRFSSRSTSSGSASLPWPSGLES